MEISEIKISYSKVASKYTSIKDSNDAYKVFIETWNKDIIDYQEEFKLLLLDRANNVIGLYHLSKGGMSQTVVDVKIIMSVVVNTGASGIILAHNHPSGNKKPSEADKLITDRVKKACQIMDVDLLDHLIITSSGYYSFMD